MPTSTLRSSYPPPYERGLVDHVVAGGQNVYSLTGKGLIYTARGTNYAIRHAAFSPDGSRLALCTQASTLLQIFEGQYPVNLAGQQTLSTPTPAGGVSEIRWAPGPGRGLYVAAGHGTTPFVSIYNIDTNTKLGNPGTLPPSTGAGVAWSPDGEYLAVAHANSPFITVYQITQPAAGADPTFTKLANPGTLPPAGAVSVCFSPVAPNGLRYLVVGGSSSVGTTNGLSFYSISGTTITFKQAQLVEDVQSVAWSPSGNRVAMVALNGTTNRLRVYRMTTAAALTTETAVTLPGTTGSSGDGVCWSSDESFLIVCQTTTPFMQAFANWSNNTTPVVMPNPSTIPTAGSTKIDCVPVRRPWASRRR